MTRLHHPASIPGLLGQPIAPGAMLLLDPEGYIVQGQSNDGVSPVPPGDFMVWKGDWASGACYNKGDVVIDGDWTAIANKYTCDRPAPQPVGAERFVYVGTSPTTATLAKELLSGHRYETSSLINISAYRVYVIAGNEYTVYSVTDPDGARVVTVQATFTASITGWQQISVGGSLIPGATAFEVVVLAREPDPVPTTFTGNWNYTTPQNPSVPASGVAQHANTGLGVIAIHKFDNDGGDRSVDLATLTVSDIIELGATRWSIQSITDQGTYIDFGVAPAVQHSTSGVQLFTFETTTASPITHVEDVNWWPTSEFPAITGLKSIDGAPLASDTNAYGIDLLAQLYETSDDWDFIAVSGGGGGTGSTVEFLDDLLDVIAPTPVAGEVLTFNGTNWVPKLSQSAIGFVELDYRFSTSIDATPAVGRIQYDNADPSLTTIVYVNQEDQAANDRSLFWDELKVGDWFNIHDPDDVAGRFQRFDVIGAPTKVGTVYHIPVSLFDQAGAVFGNNFALRVFIRYIGAEPFSGDHADLTNVLDNQHHAKYTDAEAQAANAGLWLSLSGGTLTGGLQINGGLNVDVNLHVGIAGVESFRVIRQNRGAAGEYAQFWAAAGAGGLVTAGAIIRYHDGAAVAGDYYHGDRRAGGRGFHNPPGASIPVGYVFDRFYTDGARSVIRRKVSATSQETAIIDNLGTHTGGIVMTSDGDVKVGTTPRSGSQLRNFAHSSSDSVPAGTQPGDVFLVYT